MENGDDSELLRPVDVNEIQESLRTCKNKSAVGLDGTDYRIKKRLPERHLSEIACLLTACVRLGYFPAELCVPVPVPVCIYINGEWSAYAERG